MLIEIGQESKGFEGQDVWNDKMRIPMFVKVGPEFQYSEA